MTSHEMKIGILPAVKITHSHSALAACRESLDANRSVIVLTWLNDG